MRLTLGDDRNHNHNSRETSAGSSCFRHPPSLIIFSEGRVPPPACPLHAPPTLIRVYHLLVSASVRLFWFCGLLSAFAFLCLVVYNTIYNLLRAHARCRGLREAKRLCRRNNYLSSICRQKWARMIDSKNTGEILRASKTGLCARA